MTLSTEHLETLETNELTMDDLPDYLTHPRLLEKFGDQCKTPQGFNIQRYLELMVDFNLNDDGLWQEDDLEINENVYEAMLTLGPSSQEYGNLFPNLFTFNGTPERAQEIKDSLSCLTGQCLQDFRLFEFIKKNDLTYLKGVILECLKKYTAIYGNDCEEDQERTIFIIDLAYQLHGNDLSIFDEFAQAENATARGVYYYMQIKYNYSPTVIAEMEENNLIADVNHQGYGLAQIIINLLITLQEKPEVLTFLLNYVQDENADPFLSSDIVHNLPAKNTNEMVTSLYKIFYGDYDINADTETADNYELQIRIDGEALRKIGQIAGNPETGNNQSIGDNLYNHLQRMQAQVNNQSDTNETEENDTGRGNSWKYLCEVYVMIALTLAKLKDQRAIAPLMTILSKKEMLQTVDLNYYLGFEDYYEHKGEHWLSERKKAVNQSLMNLYRYCPNEWEETYRTFEDRVLKNGNEDVINLFADLKNRADKLKRARVSFMTLLTERRDAINKFLDKVMERDKEVLFDFPDENY